MNKVGTIKINGVDYKVCLSTSVLMALEDRNGRTTDEELNAILSSTSVKDLFWLLDKMLQAGYKYAVKLGDTGVPEPPTFEDLVDCTLVSDYKTMFSDLKNAVAESSKPDVEIQNEKNAPTTPGI